LVCTRVDLALSLSQTECRIGAATKVKATRELVCVGEMAERICSAGVAGDTAQMNTCVALNRGTRRRTRPTGNYLSDILTEPAHAGTGMRHTVAAATTGALDDPAKTLPPGESRRVE
jgi:hypothetical protein